MNHEVQKTRHINAVNSTTKSQRSISDCDALSDTEISPVSLPTPKILISPPKSDNDDTILGTSNDSNSNNDSATMLIEKSTERSREEV